MALIITLIALAAVWLTMLLGGTGAFDRSVYEALYSGDRPVARDSPRLHCTRRAHCLVIGAAFSSPAGSGGHHPHPACAVLLIVLVGRGLAKRKNIGSRARVPISTSSSRREDIVVP